MTLPNPVREIRDLYNNARKGLTSRGLLVKRLSRSSDQRTQLQVADGLVARLSKGAVFRITSLSDLMGYEPSIIVLALLEYQDKHGETAGLNLVRDLIDQSRGKREVEEQSTYFKRSIAEPGQRHKIIYKTEQTTFKAEKELLRQLGQALIDIKESGHAYPAFNNRADQLREEISTYAKNNLFDIRIGRSADFEVTSR